MVEEMRAARGVEVGLAANHMTFHHHLISDLLLWR
jgi:hypothetical protein